MADEGPVGIGREAGHGRRDLVLAHEEEVHIVRRQRAVRGACHIADAEAGL